MTNHRGRYPDQPVPQGGDHGSAAARCRGRTTGRPERVAVSWCSQPAMLAASGAPHIHAVLTCGYPDGRCRRAARSSASEHVLDRGPVRYRAPRPPSPAATSEVAWCPVCYWAPWRGSRTGLTPAGDDELTTTQINHLPAMTPCLSATRERAQWTKAETPKAMARNSNIRPARTAMPKGMTDIRVSATASVTGYSGGTYTQAERKTIAAPHRGSPRAQTCGPTNLATSSETYRPAYGGDRVSAAPT